jgi:hypothetical protein
MADSRDALLQGDIELLSADVPRLAGGVDVRELARGVLMASGEATVDFASRLTDGHQPETHNENLNVTPGFRSILERLRYWRNTGIGRVATISILALPAGYLAACGSEHGAAANQPPAVAAQAHGQGGGGEAQAGNRVIIGDAACYEGFANLTAEKQATCIDEFNHFTFEQVSQLAPLDQARWALGYRDMITGGEPSERLEWTSAIKKDIPLQAVAGNILQNHTQDVMRLAWMAQQPDFKALADDRRTWAALFGMGATAESQPIQDAKSIAESNPANGLTLDMYMRHLFTTTEVFTGSPQDIKATAEKDGGYTVSFAATHNRGDTTTTFTMRYYPYLHLDTDNGKPVYRELTENDEIKILQGKPLIGMPMGNA